MIDFQSNALFKLTPIAINDMFTPITSFLIDGETVLAVFKTIRDQVIFTNKRIIATNVQGMIGKKVDYTTVPYRMIQTYSIETAGVIDLDCVLDIYINTIGKIRFEINGGFDIVAFNRVLSEQVLR